MKLIRLFCTVILLIGWSGSMYKAWSIDLSLENCRYWYDPEAAIRLNHRLVRSLGGYKVYVRLRTTEPRQDSLRVLIQRNITSSRHRILDLTIDTLQSSGLEFIFSLVLPDTVGGVLVFHYHDKQDYYFPIQLSYKGVKISPLYIKNQEKDLPAFTSYFKGDTIRIGNMLGRQPVFVYRYKEEFLPSEPPMSTSFRPSPLLKIDTMLIIEDGLLPLQDGCFFLLQTDTTQAAGLTGYAGNPYFPRLVYLEDLIEPLRYIAKNKEYATLTKASDQKKAFDSFWLNLYSVKRNAASAISRYFRRVTAANEMFTNYKPGWKTGRGMLYIILGIPDKVTRADDKETWSYKTGGLFEFWIVSNLFAYEQYVLLLHENHREHWLEAVGQLRNHQ